MKLLSQKNSATLINERAVRAGAGIMFVFGFFLLMKMYYDFHLQMAFGMMVLFWLDFLVKTLGIVRFSPFLLVGSFLVSRQKPEYVGIVQKQFAWGIGLLFSSVLLGIISYRLFFVSSCMGADSCILPFILCGICLVFMWLETSLGFCVGCHMYKKLKEKGYIQESSSENQPCPGGVCSTEKE